MEKQNIQTEKLTDKAFTRLMLTSIVGVVICIICLCSTTWAWFTVGLPNNSNQIKVAEECLLSISIKEITDDGFVDVDISGDVYLLNDVTYEVTLSLPAGSASGYCVINTSSASYYSDYIYQHSYVEDRMLTFELTVDTPQVVTFTSRWGIYSGEGSVQNGRLNIQ